MRLDRKPVRRGEPELIAREVVATLVGSIGLIAAVPITTALAALMAGRIPVDDLPAEDHAGHAH